MTVFVHLCLSGYEPKRDSAFVDRTGNIWQQNCSLWSSPWPGHQGSELPPSKEKEEIQKAASHSWWSGHSTIIAWLWISVNCYHFNTDSPLSHILSGAFTQTNRPKMKEVL